MTLHGRSFRWWMVLVVLVGLLAGCSDDAEPEVAPEPHEHASDAEPTTDAYTISNVSVEPIRGGAAWTVRFDAVWTGNGDAPAINCVWKIRKASKTVIRSGVVRLRGPGEGIRTRPVAAHQLPVRPASATVECEL